MPRINPLNRRPKAQRLVVAVRGAAGSGKSTFAASLADAGLGRLCLFDTERKARLIPGADGSTFDALEIEHPDELPEFIEWALTGEGREQGYGCYALDSWTMYFGRKHRETLQAVRHRSGDPLAQPTADELQADQMIFQEVLRRLCIDSGACVVITDQIGARGKEEREENELGRVLPMTASGLEYFVDVMLELSARLEGFELVRVARVVKSNSPAFPLGLEIPNPTFATLLARVRGSGVAVPAAVAEGAAEAEAPALPDLPDLKPAVAAPAPRVTLDGLIETASGYGLTRAQLVAASQFYHGTSQLDHLAPAQIEDLYDRLQARYAPVPEADPAATAPEAPADALDAEVSASAPAADPASNGHARKAARS